MMNNSVSSISKVTIPVGFLSLILIPSYIILYLFIWYFKTFFTSDYFIALFPLVLLGLYLLLILIVIIEAKVILAVINRTGKEGLFPAKGSEYAVLYWSLNSLFVGVIESLLDKLIIPKGVSGEVIYSLFGGKHGKLGFISTPLADPYLIEIGDNSIIGRDALVTGHYIVHDKIYIKKVIIGKNVTIGAHSTISPGAVIEDNVVVGANSFVKKDMVLEKNSIYAGSPVRLIKKNEH
ncbi:Carnitine operon protein CaiE [Candidatus Tiddalikarchaeum anstoanum]|nr:Carnitine operon protein CaiE [Candidatus Tiddalikarchaeum anstoanum]